MYTISEGGVHCFCKFNSSTIALIFFRFLFIKMILCGTIFLPIPKK